LLELQGDLSVAAAKVDACPGIRRSRAYLGAVHVTTVPNVRRLAQYRPFERGGLDLRAVLRDLVLAVASINGGSVESLFECRAAFEDLWGLEVEIDELRRAVGDLVEDELVERAGTGFRLSERTRADLEAKAQEWQATEDRAFREWELTVRREKPGVSQEDMAALREDLRTWIYLIITRHGAEAALLLYPEEERAQRLFKEVDARGFESLPERGPHLGRMRTEVLPLFIRCSTPEQRSFLAGLLNTSFYMGVLTIDPGAKQLVQDQMKGHRIYLDTNFLYAVLGAAPPDEVYSSRRLLEMSRGLGFEFAVTPWTISELRTSIARSRRDIEAQSRFLRPELAKTMLRAAGDKGFNRLIWQAYNDKKTQPKDVFDRLDHFQQELERYGIKEATEACTPVEQQEERVKLYASLVGAERWPYQREPIVLEHDAKCRLLIERLRGEGNLTVSNARFWFLTYDTKLPRFAQRVPDNGDPVPELPFCISPSAWVQIIRALTPRTEDFDRTVVDLLTSPVVGYRPAVNPSVVQEVVGRMDHFEDASPELALAILTDTAKVSEIEDVLGAEDEEELEQAISAVYSTAAHEWQQAVAASEERVAEIERELAAAEARAAEAEVARTRDREDVERTHSREFEKAKAAFDRQRAAWREEKWGLEERIEKAALNRDAALARAGNADGRIRAIEDRIEGLDKRKARNRRVTAGLGLIAVGAVGAILLSVYVFSTPGPIAGSIIAGAAFALGGVRVLAGREHGTEILTWGGALLAIASIVVAIVLNSS
jgi:hypothetical protein